MIDSLVSVRLRSSPYGRSDFGQCECVCQFIACMCTCCVCVCVSAYVRRLHRGHLLCMHCMSVSSTREREVTSPGGFLLMLCVCVRQCVWQRRLLVRLHDSRYSYGVLLCADAWLVWDGVRVRVCYEWACVCVCESDSRLCEFFDVQLCFDRRCCTIHSMSRSSRGHLVSSGCGKRFLLSVTWQEGLFVFLSLLRVNGSFLLPPLVFNVKTLIGRHLVRNFPNRWMWMLSLWKALDCCLLFSQKT